MRQGRGRDYVLVHGASHGAWCWDEVRARLAARGHRVITLDLPGHGRRAAEFRRASVAAYAAAPFLERMPLGQFYAMPVPRTYVRCLRDVAVPPDQAFGYAARLGVRPVDLNRAHGPMLSDPDGLVAILDRIPD